MPHATILSVDVNVDVHEDGWMVKTLGVDVDVDAHEDEWMAKTWSGSLIMYDA